MTGKSITRADLCAAVYQTANVSPSEALAIVELFLKEITDTLVEGETVRLSSFGMFIVRKKNQRIGRNPKTGAQATVSACRVAVFKPSGILKQQLNGKRPAPRKPVAELGSSASAR